MSRRHWAVPPEDLWCWRVDVASDRSRQRLTIAATSREDAAARAMTLAGSRTASVIALRMHRAVDHLAGGYLRRPYSHETAAVGAD
jgi:hypothetical protein